MNRRLRIAMVAACPFPYPRGTPVRIFRMAEALGRKGHEVHVVTYHLGENIESAPFQIHRIPEIKTYRKYSPGPTYQKMLVVNPFLIRTLRKVLKAHEVDLIHAHHYEGLVVALYGQIKPKQPIVYDAHTLLESELPFYPVGLPKQIKRVIGRLLDRRLPRQAAHVITTTEKIKRRLLELDAVVAEDVSVVMNGVECEFFNSRNPNRSGTEMGKKMVVFAGNLAPYQGIEYLLKAFREVLNRRQDVRLLIVSDSPFDMYERMVDTLEIRNSIHLVGGTFNKLPTYLANADIAVNPRTSCDGIPQKLLNYMAAGKAIVSFEGSMGPLEHGKTGWVVEDGNCYAFAEAILCLLDDSTLARRLGSGARDHVANQYTWEKASEKIEAVYDRVLINVSEQKRLETLSPLSLPH